MMNGKIYSTASQVTIIPPIGEGAFIYPRPRRNKGQTIEDNLRRLVKWMLDELAEEAKEPHQTVSPVWWVKHPFTVSITKEVIPGTYIYSIFKNEET